MFRNFPSIVKSNIAMLLLGGSALTTVSAQTCPPTVNLTPAGTWSAATPNPAPFGPYNNCTNTDGKTTHTNYPNDHGFYSEYDGTPTWNWSRNVTGLDPSKTYQVYIHMETENTYHTRHLIFNYNLAGQSGTYTTAGDAGGSSIGILKTFNVTGQSTLNFTGNLHADAYQGCQQAQELRFNLAVMQVDTIPNVAPEVSTFVVRNNTCPSTTLDLTGLVTSTCAAGSTLEWHSSPVATAANKVANPAAASQGTYFAFCRKASGNCYSPASTPVLAKPKSCVNNLVDDNVTAVTPVDQNVGEGDITTNDVIAPGSTIGSPTRLDFGPRFGIQLFFMPDGTYFYLINNPTPWTYQFSIPVCPPGEVDPDGCPTETLSITVPAARGIAPTTTSTVSTSEKAFVYPNPVVNGTFTFVYQNDAVNNDVLNIQLTDMSGRAVYTAKQNVTSGVNKIQIQPNGLSKGIYYLKYNNAEMTINGTTKVVIN